MVPIFALVVALGVLVAIASEDPPLLREGRVDRLVILIEVGALAVLGLLLAVSIAFVVHRAFVARRAQAPSLRVTLLRAMPVSSVAFAVLVLLVIGSTDLGRAVGPVESGGGRGMLTESSDRRALPLTITGWFESGVRASEGEAEQEALGEGADPGDRGPTLLIVVAAAGLLMTLVVFWRWSAARSPSGRDTDDGPADRMAGAVHGAVAGTIDAMLADPDPNTAIRGAYARLLEGLDASGTGRRDHEAPMEHLQRVLMTLRVRPEPLRQLTELFAIARFSTRPMTQRDRERALDALRAVAADLSVDVAITPPTARPGPPLGPPP